MILLLFLLAPLVLSSVQAALPQDSTPATPQVETTYDSVKDKTTVRLSAVKISGEKDKYYSVSIAPSFSYPGRSFKKPEFIDFEVETVVKTKLKIDLYVVFVVDGETIFLSSSRSAVKKPLPGKRWIGERLVFRMPYDTLMKLSKANTVEIKMDGVRFPIKEPVLQKIRDLAHRLE